MSNYIQPPPVVRKLSVPLQDWLAELESRTPHHGDVTTLIAKLREAVQIVKDMSEIIYEERKIPRCEIDSWIYSIGSVKLP
jgi:hypothetical protein